LSSLIKAVADDGSILPLAPNTLVMTVEDDVPLLNPGFEEGEFQFVPAVTGFVDEGGLTRPPRSAPTATIPARPRPPPAAPARSIRW
jgi:hypothetical protein